LSTSDLIHPPNGLFDSAVNLIGYKIKQGMDASKAVDFITEEVFPYFGAEFRISLEQAFGL